MIPDDIAARLVALETRVALLEKAALQRLDMPAPGPLPAPIPPPAPYPFGIALGCVCPVGAEVNCGSSVCPRHRRVWTTGVTG